MYTAVILDCDGVIINSEILHLQASNKAYSDYGVSFTKKEYFERYVGISDMDQLKKKLSNSNVTFSHADIITMLEIKKRAYIKCLSSMKKLPFLPGLTEYIKLTVNRGKILGVCSGSTSEELYLILERLGNGQFLKYFSTVVSIDDVKNGKPDSEGYKLACKNIGQETRSCLAIEDSPAGIMAAKNAGLDVYGILSTHSPEKLNQARLLFKDFYDIKVD